jgi:hypothetical protein
MRGDNLDCDVSSQAPIARLVDLSHTTGAERRGNLVWAKADAGAHATWLALSRLEFREQMQDFQVQPHQGDE